MAHYYTEPSHTFSEYLLIPGYTSEDCIPDNVSLRTPLVRYRKGQEECPICLNIPMTSAIMQSVSNDTLAIALAKEGGLSFIYGSQSIESEAEMVRRVKSHKAGFVVSASNLTPEHTLADVLALKEKNGFSTVAITENAQPNGKLLGIVTSRDYRVSRMCVDTKVRDFMTPRERLITAPSTTTLREANDLIWEHKLNALPIVDENDCLLYFVFRKDYSEHKEHPLALQDAQKRYLVGAGVNSRDYRERIPALIEVSAARDEYFKETGIYVPICSDGGIVHDYHMTLALAMGADFLMLGRYFARFDESPTSKLLVGGVYVKEYWGEGSNRARNWQRYDLGGKSGLMFEEGVDSYVTYAGSLQDNVARSLYKVKSTMCNCGVTTIPDLQRDAKLTLVSSTSIVEGGYHDVTLRSTAGSNS